jgi:hypothetical protein
VEVGFGPGTDKLHHKLIYGRAVLQIKPFLVLDVKAELSGPDKLVLDLSLKMPITYKFTFGYNIPLLIKTFSGSTDTRTSTIATYDFKLTSVRLRSSHNAEIRSLGDFRALNSADESSPITDESVSVPPCLFGTKNVTIPWQAALSNATLSSRTKLWQLASASLVDTCEFKTGDVDSEAWIFTAPVTGYYVVRATVDAISPESLSNRWNAFARISDKTGFCGNFAFCASLSAENRLWMGEVYMTVGASISLSWSSGSAGSDAIITTTFSLDLEPLVYVNSVTGNNNFDGSRRNPVETLERGLDLLATKIGPNVKTATIILMPTLKKNLQFPSNR